MRVRKLWNVTSSTYAKSTFNPIRHIIESLEINPNPEKSMIALSIGDPTVFGNLELSEEIKTAILESVQSGKFNGYGPSTGFEEAKKAVAHYCSTSETTWEAKDIILCSGCSCALDISIMALASPGQNILIPRPGFPLYQTLAEGLGIAVKFYDLLPEKNWEVDLEMLSGLIDDSTAALVVNNPSNPCGSVFSKSHIKEILKIAQENKLPIIADEIYDHFVFKSEDFHWIGSLTNEVPILSCGGLTKRFLVPGWRTGWICIQDKQGYFDAEIRKGLQSLSQRIIGSNTLVQGALPSILNNTPPTFFSNNLNIIQKNARIAFSILSNTKGLNPIMPQGAMYMMVGLDMKNFAEFENDLQFVEKMISEESVFCLPGKCFNVANYFRIVLTVPEKQMQEACERIQEFCSRHFIPPLISYDASINNEKQFLDTNNSNCIPSDHHLQYEKKYRVTHNSDHELLDSDINGDKCNKLGIQITRVNPAISVNFLKNDIITTEMDGQ